MIRIKLWSWDECKAFDKANIDKGGYAQQYPPGTMWYVPWYFDPTDNREAPERLQALDAIAKGTFSRQDHYLSRFYWEDWSATRSPLCVICPGGRQWCIDARSSNGEGWKVTGSAEDGTLTCAPSIMVENYHGFLQNGQFTLDCETGGVHK